MKNNFLLLLACSLLSSFASAQSLIKDTDGNTSVETEANFNENRIRFKLNGVEIMRLEKYNSGAYGINLDNNQNNILMGAQAGSSTTTGVANIFVGPSAGLLNTTGNNNVFTGMNAGTNSTGSSNVFVGYSSGTGNTTGSANTFVGENSGRSNAGSNSNVYIGSFAGQANTTGNSNAALGANAGNSQTNSGGCTFLGKSANASVNNLSNSTAIGFNASVNASNKIRLGNTAVSVIEGNVAYTTSDGRFKSNIRPDAPGLDFVMALEPVTYNFNYTGFSEFLKESEADKNLLAEKSQQREMGFVAQQMEQVCAKQGIYVTNLVHTPESEADNYAVAYGQLVVPLVKAVQEQQAEIEAQRAEIDALKQMVAQLLANREGTFRLYPNPASDRMQADGLPLATGGVLAVYNAEGKLLATQPVTAATATIEVGNWPTGMYRVVFSAPGSASQTGTFIK